MKEAKLDINDKIYIVKVCETEEEYERGLMDVISMDDNEGMLFPGDKEEEVSFWMHDTSLPLDIIFLDEDGNVTKVAKGSPNDDTPITGIAQDVLELNQNSGVEVGDQVFYADDDENITIRNIYVLGPDGKPQAELEGGERIFSRANTKTLIKMAKRAFKSKSEKDYRSLGKKVFSYIQTQNENEPEYTSLSN